MCRRHFADGILFNENVWFSIEIYILGSNRQYSNTGLDDILAPNRQQLSESMTAYFTDAYMRYSASMG